MISTILIMLISIWLGWYYIKLRKIKRIYNNIIYFYTKNRIRTSEKAQSYLVSIINEFEMSDKENKFINNISSIVGYFYSEECCVKLEKEYTEILRNMNWYNNFNDIKKIYNEYNKCSEEDLHKSIRKKFQRDVMFSNRDTHGMFKSNDEVLNDIKMFIDDEYSGGIPRIKIKKHNDFKLYLEKHQYKTNVVFSNYTSLLYDFDSIVNNLDEIYLDYTNSYNNINSLKLKINKKKITIWDIIQFDISYIFRNNNSLFYCIMIPIIILLIFLINKLLENY